MREWIAKIKRKNFKPTAYTRICSVHFEEDCFSYQPFTKKRFLKPTAVPTKFIFNSRPKIKRKRTSYTVANNENERISPYEPDFNEETLNKESLTDIQFGNFINELSISKAEIDVLKIH